MRHHQSSPLEFATTARAQERLGTTVALAFIGLCWFVIVVLFLGLILPVWYPPQSPAAPVSEVHTDSKS